MDMEEATFRGVRLDLIQLPPHELRSAPAGTESSSRAWSQLCRRDPDGSKNTA